MFDYHVHTLFCGHAYGSMEEYVLRAVELGLEEIGFSGHYPYPPSFEETLPNCVIPAQSYPVYLAEAARLREAYRDRIVVRIGAEFDYLGDGPSFHPLDEARRLGLDFCLASVHLVDGVAVDYTPELLEKNLQRFTGGIDGVYDRYYRTLLEMVAPGYCTTVGHLDLVKKFNTLAGLAPGLDHSSMVEQVLERIASSGIAVEINTSGWDKPCGEQYPAIGILKKALELGIALTAGSDAHRPEEVGRHFDRLKVLLNQLGVRQLMRFEKLQAVPCDI